MRAAKEAIRRHHAGEPSQRRCDASSAAAMAAPISRGRGDAFPAKRLPGMARPLVWRISRSASLDRIERDWRYKRARQTVMRKVTRRGQMNGPPCRARGFLSAGRWGASDPSFGAPVESGPARRRRGRLRSMILHSKATGPGRVGRLRAAPESRQCAPNAQAIQDALSRYVVVGIADGPRDSGSTACRSTLIQDLKIADASHRVSFRRSPQTPHLPKWRKRSPPCRGLARQKSRTYRTGMRWFVFDGSTIHSCQPGKIVSARMARRNLPPTHTPIPAAQSHTRVSVLRRRCGIESAMSLSG